MPWERAPLLLEAALHTGDRYIRPLQAQPPNVQAVLWPQAPLGGARPWWCENHARSWAYNKGSGFSGDVLGQYNLKQSSSHVNLTTVKHKKCRIYELMN